MGYFRGILFVGLASLFLGFFGASGARAQGSVQGSVEDEVTTTLNESGQQLQQMQKQLRQGLKGAKFDPNLKHEDGSRAASAEEEIRSGRYAVSTGAYCPPAEGPSDAFKSVVKLHSDVQSSTDMVPGGGSEQSTSPVRQKLAQSLKMDNSTGLINEGMDLNDQYGKIHVDSDGAHYGSGSNSKKGLVVSPKLNGAKGLNFDASF
jgi:hypothetical protein